MLGRLSAAEALVKKAKTNAQVAKALSDAWKREKPASTRHEMFAVLCNGEETFRAALVEGSNETRSLAFESPRSVVWRDLPETINPRRSLRAAWKDPKQPYGSRKAALRGLIGWKVKDAPALLAEALKITAGDHTIAAEALELIAGKARSQGPGAGRSL